MEEDSGSSSQLASARADVLMAVGSFAERKLPTRNGHAIRRDQTLQIVTSCFWILPWRHRGGCRRRHCSNQYFLAHVGCHVLCVRGHATEAVRATLQRISRGQRRNSRRRRNGSTAQSKSITSSGQCYTIGHLRRIPVTIWTSAVCHAKSWKPWQVALIRRHKISKRTRSARLIPGRYQRSRLSSLGKSARQLDNVQLLRPTWLTDPGAPINPTCG
ncbi:hypothetical protein BKA63DRAFT_132731 [Paraphoma chrysanthemicola]|nr:hypothetical protein BKA63DRAFT_132731 [Paraphoma chrysanthemicola]